LQKDINHFSVLIHSSSEVVLFTVDFMVRHTGEDFIDVKAVAETSMPSF
jgi:hypothetical protein